MTTNNYPKYDEDFKKSLVSLHQNVKTQAQKRPHATLHMLTPNEAEKLYW